MAKKFIMPKTVKIGGIVHNVIFPYNFPDSPEEVGHYCFATALIKIADTYKDKPRAKSSIHQTLLHEIIHGIDAIYCDFSIDPDPNIDRFATGWYDILINNNLYLNKDHYFPKKIKIGGYVYNIVYPYEIVDSRNMYAVDFEGKVIKIYGENGTSPHAERQSFIASILHIIRHSFSIDEPFNGNGNGNSVLFNNLASGFHQVLVDNDIEKVIKSGI